MVNFDQDALRGVPGETRLPVQGAPIVVAPLGKDVVVLEQARGSELRARRVDAAGSTAWVTPLGILATTEYQAAATTSRPSGGFSSDFPKPVVAVHEGKVMVLWARLEGSGPSLPAPVTLVVTTLATGGAVQATVTLKPLSSTDVGHFFAVGSNGDVTVAHQTGGWDSADPTVVERFSSSGSLLWKDEVAGRPRSPWSLAVVDDSTYSISGGRFVRWNAAGTRTSDREAPEGWSHLTAVDDRLTRRTAADPALIVHLTHYYPSNRSNSLCIVDEQGQPLASTAADNSWAPARAWLTPSGLLVEGKAGALLHGESGEHLVSFDRRGNVVREVVVGSAGGRELHPEVTVEDVAVTDDRALVAVGTRSDLVAGVDLPEPPSRLLPTQLETWHFLVRLAPPAGAGDLDNVPPPR